MYFELSEIGRLFGVSDDITEMLTRVNVPKSAAGQWLGNSVPLNCWERLFPRILYSLGLAKKVVVPWEDARDLYKALEASYRLNEIPLTPSTQNFWQIIEEASLTS